LRVWENDLPGAFSTQANRPEHDFLELNVFDQLGGVPGPHPAAAPEPTLEPMLLRITDEHAKYNRLMPTAKRYQRIASQQTVGNTAKKTRLLPRLLSAVSRRWLNFAPQGLPGFPSGKGPYA
jgi:hypothetical protein